MPSMIKGLDTDVYQVIRKLEDSDRGLTLTVPAVFAAIKRSNSSLARVKKTALEGAIERALSVRLAEIEDSDSDEEELDLDPLQTKRPEPSDERFLLNRQMTKYWNMAAPSSSSSVERKASKKRKLGAEPQGQEQPPGEPLSRPESVAAESSAKQAKKPTSKGYVVERIDAPVVVAGMDDLVAKITEAASLIPLQDVLSKGYTEQEQSIRHFVYLLSGPSGNGKKTIVRHIAQALGQPLLYIRDCFSDPDRLDRRMSDCFEEAKAAAPCVLLLENVDDLMRKSDGASVGDQSLRNRWAFAGLLRRLNQELPFSKPAVCFATTSLLASLDLRTLLLFHDVFNVPMPKTEARREILQFLGTHHGLKGDGLDLDALARATHGFVGRDFLTTAAAVQQRVKGRVVASGCLAEATANNYRPTTEDFLKVYETYVPILRKDGFTEVPSISWDDVGALEKARDALYWNITFPIENPEKLARMGYVPEAGILLWGPPGCGKTMVAQAAANQAQTSFIVVQGPELLNKYVGESERGVRDLFTRARSSTPCIIFFDEIDALAPHRDSSTTEATRRVVNTLLAELDGTNGREGVFVIAATNRPDVLDEALLRPGRLDTKVFVDLPTEDERVDILKTTVSRKVKHHVDGDVLESVARRCEDYSGADLAALVRSATMAVFRSGRHEILEDDWEAAMSSMTKSIGDPGFYRKLAAKLDNKK